VRLLLDTHVLLWWLAGDGLSRSASKAISTSDDVFVSAATVWEMSIKESLGRLTVPGNWQDAIEADFDSLPISFEHAWEVGRLPPHHRDPFDRMLIAQARVEELAIVTADPVFAGYDVSLVR
jgi:PIN domain nuclease of toxin-antitoxin system